VRNERLRGIYKRGRMHSMQVLLGSHSFADLLNRYKYLHLMALYDRMVVQDVGGWSGTWPCRSASCARRCAGWSTCARRRPRGRAAGAAGTGATGHAAPVPAAGVADGRSHHGAGTRAAAPHQHHRRPGASPPRGGGTQRHAVAAASITTRDLGTLQWPVDGTVLYRFGPDRKPDGIVLKHQGIGIGAPAGTPVRVVESGVVEFAGAFPGYGPTVIVSHGGGFRTLYLYLRNISVRVGDRVASGQVIGTVGGEQTAEGAHIEFQVRIPVDGGVEPVDPLTWLRSRAGRQP
jgi:murein hydrolase activator